MSSIISTVLAYFFSLLKIWGQLFLAPFLNLEMLWVIIPAYLNWIFADFFQEKKGTSLGNAISNAVIVLWAAIDWLRTSLRFYSGKIIGGWHLFGNIIDAAVVFLFGTWIVYEGVKGKKITHYLGRVRVVTYIVIMITPLVYGMEIPLLKAIIAIILFFPVFYYLIELIDYSLPNPASIREDEGKNGFDGFGQ